MKMPKLIILYGFAASGKTTIAKKYIDNNPLTIAIEGDQIIGMMGQWRAHEDEARKIVFEHTKSITKNQLSAGYDVLLPYLLTDSTQIEELEDITKECDATFHEVYITIEKEDAINRLLKRGVWGEEGSPQLTKDNLPEIDDLYQMMEREMSKRGDVKSIMSDIGDIDGTYQKLLTAIQLC